MGGSIAWWGGKKGLAGVTKGMVVRGARGGAVHVGRLNMPSCSLIHDCIVIAFVSSASSWALKGMKWMGWVFLFDVIGVAVILGAWGGAIRRSSSGSVITLPPRMGRLVCGSHCGMKGSKIAHHALILVLLIGMYGLRMLTKIVETRELFTTVTCERTFTSVLPNVSGKMLATTEDHTTLAIASALESFCRSWTITFIYTAGRDRGRMVSNQGGHCGHIWGRLRLLLVVCELVEVIVLVRVGRRRRWTYSVRAFEGVQIGRAHV